MSERVGTLRHGRSRQVVEFYGDPDAIRTRDPQIRNLLPAIETTGVNSKKIRRSRFWSGTPFRYCDRLTRTTEARVAATKATAGSTLRMRTVTVSAADTHAAAKTSPAAGAAVGLKTT